MNFVFIVQHNNYIPKTVLWTNPRYYPVLLQTPGYNDLRIACVVLMNVLFRVQRVHCARLINIHHVKSEGGRPGIEKETVRKLATGKSH